MTNSHTFASGVESVRSWGAGHNDGSKTAESSGMPQHGSVSDTGGSTTEQRFGVGPTARSVWMRSYRSSVLLTDGLVVSGMVFASQSLHFAGDRLGTVNGLGGLNYWTLSAILILVWMIALAVNGVWDLAIVGSANTEFQRIVRGSVYLFGLVAVLAFFARADVARGYLAMALPLGVLGLVCSHWVWRMLLREHRSVGSHMSSVLIVGGRESALSLASRLVRSPESGYKVVGLCVPQNRDRSAGLGVVGGDLDTHGLERPVFRVVGDLSDVVLGIRKSAADTVAVSISELFGPEEVRALAWQLEGSGVSLLLAPALTDVAGPRIHIKPVVGLPLMQVLEPTYRGPKLVTKLCLDTVLASAGLVLALPVILLFGCLIKLTDGGPAFFRHERVGLGGKHFKVLKLRSMRVGGKEIELGAVAGPASLQGDIFYKSQVDPRITRIGRFIRKTSIDELPQLVNVILGQMSLVGPRPLVPGEGAEVGGFVERRIKVRPGITGLWQISGRSDSTAEERIRLDFYYVENWSVTNDLFIIGKTIGAVLSRSGAY